MKEMNLRMNFLKKKKKNQTFVSDGRLLQSFSNLPLK